MSNLIGCRFGRLMVLCSDAEKPGYVICQCDCGNAKSIRSTSLTKQKEPTRSCGCIQKAAAHNVGVSVIAKNSAKQIATNMAFNTNFQVISSSTPPTNNRSGYKGVSWDSKRNLWAAYINVHGKRTFLGRYPSLGEAADARRKAEKKYFAPLLQQRNEAQNN